MFLRAEGRLENPSVPSQAVEANINSVTSHDLDINYQNKTKFTNSKEYLSTIYPFTINKLLAVAGHIPQFKTS